MATITELRTDLAAARKAEDAARHAALDAAETDAPDKNAVHARYMRAAKATKALEKQIDQAELRAARPNGTTRAESPYRPDSEHSFFTDLHAAAATRSAEAIERLQTNEAVARGASARATGYTEGAGFMGPSWMADAWAELPRQQNVLAEAFQEIPLVERGLKGYVPKVTGGVTSSPVFAQDKSGGVNDDVGDYTVGLATDTAVSELATVAGVMDVNRQIAERVPGADFPLALDLVSAVYTALDYEQINGPGSQARLNGLLVASGTNSYTYNDASPTGEELLTALWQASSEHYQARKRRPDYVVMHSRRWNWLAATLSTSFPLISQGDANAPRVAGMRVLIDDNMPTNLGSGTDSDAIVLLTGNDVYHAESLVRFRYNQVASGTLMLRYECVLNAYLWADRRPEGVTIMTGTGFAPVSGF